MASYFDSKARAEFEHDTKEKDVTCAWVCFRRGDMFLGEDRIYLKKGYTSQEYEEFLQKIDRDYDPDSESHEVDGVIWLSDGGWFKRFVTIEESERWILVTPPVVPEQCEEPPTVKSATKKE